MKDKKDRQWLITKLRRISLYWPARQECLNASKIERGVFRCNHCKMGFGRKEINIDHIDPVVKITGFINWDDYISKLFCDSSMMQILCLQCHSNKTLTEGFIREAHRQKQKKSVKKIDKKK